VKIPLRDKTLRAPRSLTSKLEPSLGLNELISSFYLGFLSAALCNPPYSSAASFNGWAFNRSEESEVFAEEGLANMSIAFSQREKGA